MLTAALAYLDAGWRPIPCERSPNKERDKKPYVRWRDYQQRVPTREEVTQWWTQWPGANVAVLTGFGVVVIDLDGPEAETLLHEHGVVLADAAPRVKTGKGQHVYFRSTTEMRNNVRCLERNGSGVDFRGDGGYVLAPPSVHGVTGTSYTWVNGMAQRDALPLIPERFVFLLNTVKKPPSTAPVDGVRGPGWVVELLRGVGEGQRDQSCARLAGYFIGIGLPNDVTTEILRQFGERCTPPFALGDVRKTVASVERSHAKNAEQQPGDDTPADATPRGPTVEHVSGVLIDTLAEIRSGGTQRVKTGFPLLDDYLGGGFGAGELIYLGARSGVGKTGLALQIIVSAARQGHAALIVSREMVNTALARRMLSQEGQIHAGSLRRGTVSHWGDVEQAAHRLSELPLWLTDTALSLADTRIVIESIPGGVQFLVVDYLQLVRAPDLRKDRRLQVEAISQGLKELAVALKIPVLCVSALSRQPATSGEEKRPTLSSLKESGELEYDADVVLLLHREMGKDYAECLIAKNRDGQTGTTALLFKAHYVSFVEVASQHGSTNPDDGRYR